MQIIANYNNLSKIFFTVNQKIAQDATMTSLNMYHH
jgi:hypothetical protein